MNYFQHEFKKKKKISNIFYYTLILIFILGSVYIGLQSVKYYFKIQKLNENTEALTNNLSNLTLELQNKKRELSILNSEAGKEEYLRKMYPAIKEGEKIIVLYDSTSTDNYEVIDNSKYERDPSSWQKFRIFMNKYTNIPF